MRDRRHVFDAEDLETRGLQGANGGLAAGTRTAHEDLDLLEPVFHALAGRRLGGDLGRERSALARALETDRAGALPGDDVALFVGERHQGVVERGLDVRLADGDVLANLAPLASFGSLGSCHFCSRPPGRLLAFELLLAAPRAHGLLGTLAGARVGLGALAVHRHAAPVTDAAVAADVHEPLDVLGALAAQVAFDGDGTVDRLAQAHDFFFSQIADLGVGVDGQLGEDGLGGGPAHAVDVGETDLDPLLRRDVDARDTCHSLPLPLPMARVGADHLDDAVAPDDLALLADRLD